MLCPCLIQPRKPPHKRYKQRHLHSSDHGRSGSAHSKAHHVHARQGRRETVEEMPCKRVDRVSTGESLCVLVERLEASFDLPDKLLRARLLHVRCERRKLDVPPSHFLQLKHTVRHMSLIVTR